MNIVNTHYYTEFKNYIEVCEKEDFIVINNKIKDLIGLAQNCFSDEAEIYSHVKLIKQHHIEYKYSLSILVNPFYREISTIDNKIFKDYEIGCYLDFHQYILYDNRLSESKQKMLIRIYGKGKLFSKNGTEIKNVEYDSKHYRFVEDIYDNNYSRLIQDVKNNFPKYKEEFESQILKNLTYENNNNKKSRLIIDPNKIYWKDRKEE